MSSPWPAMPTTSVANRSGTISDLIMRRKTVDRIWRSDAWNPVVPSGRSGNRYPTRTPTTIEMTIHCVCVIRRKPERAGVGAAAVSTPVIDSAIRGKTGRAAAQRRVAEAVQEVQGQPDGQPDREALPRVPREAPHHEQACRGAAEAHRPHEGDAERPRAVGLGVAQNEHADTHEREGEQRADVREVVRLARVADQRP